MPRTSRSPSARSGCRARPGSAPRRPRTTATAPSAPPPRRAPRPSCATRLRRSPWSPPSRCEDQAIRLHGRRGPLRAGRHLRPGRGQSRRAGVPRQQLDRRTSSSTASATTSSTSATSTTSTAIEVLRGPNAMIFGRGGAGGVINRVTRKPPTGTRRANCGWRPARTTTIAPPSTSARPFGDFALRVTGLWQESESYRDGVHLDRCGVNPTDIAGASATSCWSPSATSTSRTSAPPTAASRRSWAARSTPTARPSSATRTQSVSRAEVDALTAVLEYRFDSGLIAAQPHALGAATTSSTRTSSPAR